MNETKLFTLDIDLPIYIKHNRDNTLDQVLNFIINEDGQIIGAFCLLEDNRYILWDKTCWNEISTNEDYTTNHPFLMEKGLSDEEREQYINEMTNPVKVVVSEDGSEVKIGKTIWSTVNLDSGVFRDGSKILEAKTKKQWMDAANSKTPAFCYYKNKDTGKGYGRLYNYYAVSDSRNLAPEGWRVATLSDFRQLDDNFDTIDALKSEEGWKTFEALGITGWGAGTNESGWNGLPGGVRAKDGQFNGETELASWWIADQPLEYREEARVFGLGYNDTEVMHGSAPLYFGCYVRLVKE